MSEQIRQAVWEGEVQVGPVALKVVVLDDGERVIDANSFERFMEWLLDGSADSPLSGKEAIAVAKLMRERGIPDLADFESPAPPEF